MKTLMITGAAGFLGSHLCDEAVKNGWKTIGIDNFFRGKPQYVNKSDNFVFEEVDMLNLEDLKNIISRYKPEIIVHYAAINGTEYFYEKPWQVVEHNINMTMNLVRALEILAYKPEKLVYASSSEIYGEVPREIPTKEEMLVTLDISAVRDSYASSKAIGEFIIKNFCHEVHLKYLIFRIFNAYGPRMDTTKYGQVVPEFIRKARDDQKFEIIGDGQHTRSFCFVNDHARMAIDLIKEETNSVINLGDNNETRIIDLASTICKIMNVEFNPYFLKPRKNDPPRRCPDIGKLLSLVQGPQYNLKEGLEETIKWYLDNGNQ
jgi:nucleoside-diphosphate-sugar epimerase